MEIQTHSNECVPPHEVSIIILNDNILPQNVDQIQRKDGKIDDTSCQVNSTYFFVDLFSQLMKELKGDCTSDQQLLELIFFSVMGTISLFHLILGLELLEKTGVGKSFSPVLLYFFKYSLATFTGGSLTWAEVHGSPRKIFKMRKNCDSCLRGLALPLFLVIFREQCSLIVCYVMDICLMVTIGNFIGGGKAAFLVKLGFYTFLQIMMLPVLARINPSSQLLVVIPFMNSIFTACSNLQLLNSIPLVLCFLDKGVTKLMPVALANVHNVFQILKNKKIWKLIRYAVGLVGTIIFQNFFRLTTFEEIKAFLYLATSWLAVLTLLDASQDFGILNFLLGNTILGSTVSQSGLKSTTWFTCGVCLLLYVLRLNFKSMTFPNLETMRRPPYLFWILYILTNIESLYCLVHQI